MSVSSNCRVSFGARSIVPWPNSCRSPRISTWRTPGGSNNRSGERPTNIPSTYMLAPLGTERRGALQRHSRLAAQEPSGLSLPQGETAKPQDIQNYSLLKEQAENGGRSWLRPWRLWQNSRLRQPPRLRLDHGSELWRHTRSKPDRQPYRPSTLRSSGGLQAYPLRWTGVAFIHLRHVSVNQIDFRQEHFPGPALPIRV